MDGQNDGKRRWARGEKASGPTCARRTWDICDNNLDMFRVSEGEESVYTIAFQEKRIFRGFLYKAINGTRYLYKKRCRLSRDQLLGEM